MMNSTFDKMEFCVEHSNSHDDRSFDKTITCLGDHNWRVRYAAAIALGDRKDPKAVDALIRTLKKESQEPLFSQPALEGGAHAGSNIPFSVIFPEGTTEGTKEAWRRRGRLIQAICLALGNIGASSPAALEMLHFYAADQKCDYSVRAAACKALGQIASPESLPVLQKAVGDEEWCTSCEAKKAVESINSIHPRILL
ncbi:MAG: HEAT repeat domain-containing protein [Victivallales bacterium]